MSSPSVDHDRNNGATLDEQYVLRMATPDDATSIIELQNRLGQEEDFLLVTPIDPVTGSSLVKASLENAGAPRTSCVIVAEYCGQIVGLVLCRDHMHPYLKGMAQLALCVDRRHRRLGLGSSLLFKIIVWAEETGIRRLQLAMIADNDAALATYEKTGFEIEGTLKNAAVIRSTTFDLFIMARQVNQQSSTDQKEL